MAEDSTAVEEERRAGLFASRREHFRQRFRESRQKRMAVHAPNFAEYALVLCLAAINDLADYLLVIFNVTGIVLVIIRLIDILTGVALTLWAYFRGIERFQRGSNSKPASRIWRMVLAWIIELIPFLGELSPTWTLTVLIAYRKHRKAYRAGERSRQAEGGEYTMDFAEEAA